MYTKIIVSVVAGAVVLVFASIVVFSLWKDSGPPRLTPVWGPERQHTLAERAGCVWYIYPLDYSGTGGLHPAPVAGTDFTDIFIGVNGHQIWTKVPDGTSSNADSFMVSDHGRSFRFVKGVTTSEGPPSNAQGTLYTLTVTHNDREVLQANLIAQCR